MKKIIGIIAVVLFFLILLVLVVIKLIPSNSSSPHPPSTQDPFKGISANANPVAVDNASSTALTCYTWYLKVYLIPSTLDQRASLPQAQQCFTSSFLSQWNSILSSTEGDPVLTVSDYFPTWGSAITTKTVGQSIRSSDQQITLGTGDEQFTVVAHLIRLPDQTWKIDSVSKR